MKRRLRMLLRLFAALLLLVALAASLAWRHRPGLEQLAAHRYAPAASPGRLQASWYGVSALLLRDGEHTLFIDPFYSRPEDLLRMLGNREIAPDGVRIKAWLARAGVVHVDAVLASHSHFDHAMDVGEVARQTGAMVIGSPSTANIARGAGLPESRIRIVESGQAMRIGRFTLTFIDARHAGATGGAPTGDIRSPLRPPARYTDYRQGGSYSILVEHPQGSLLHHGSAGFVAGALAGKRADVVFLGVALIDELPSYLREVVDAVGARRVVPVHWDDFTRSLDAPLTPMPMVVRLDRFFPEVERLRPDIQLQVLPMGQAVDLFPPSQREAGPEPRLH